MNPQVICLLVLVATVYAGEKVDTLPITYLHSAPVAFAPSYYESVLPTYNYYRVANLPLDRFPPGIDPLKCPNYPYCGTDAGKLVVPPVAPIIPSVAPIVPPVAPILPAVAPIIPQISFAPIVPSDAVESAKILKSTDVEADDNAAPVSRLSIDSEHDSSVESAEKVETIKPVPLTYYTLPQFTSRFWYPYTLRTVV